jgi:hypothetical protein
MLAAVTVLVISFLIHVVGVIVVVVVGGEGR